MLKSEGKIFNSRIISKVIKPMFVVKNYQNVFFFNSKIFRFLFISSKVTLPLETENLFMKNYGFIKFKEFITF
jgi:hypothetical protein